MLTNLDYRIIYPLGSAILLVVWAVIFYLRKDLRQSILVSSIIMGIFGVLAEAFYFRDYWFPPAFIEASIGPIRVLPDDVLFGFVLGGIMISCYPFLLRLKLTGKGVNLSVFARRYLYAVIIVFVLFSVLILGLRMNSIIASGVACFIGTVFIVIRRRELLVPAIAAGIICGVGAFVFYYLLQAVVGNGYLYSVWLLDHTTNATNFLGIDVPLTEVFFATFTGPLVAILLPFLSEQSYVKIHTGSAFQSVKN